MAATPEAALSGSNNNGDMYPAGSITFSRVVDLSHPIYEEMPQWPGDPPAQFETVARREREGYFLRRFSLGEHSGTH
ncbi:MAG: cyclase family protein, partial [Dehalococcoidia bacterium]